MLARPLRPGLLRSTAGWLVMLLLAGLVVPAATLAQSRENVIARPASIAVDNGCGGGDTSGDPPGGPFSIAGRVTDGSGNGIADIRVRARTTTPLVRTSETTTNPDGDFVVSDLTDEDFAVTFWDETGVYQSGFWSAGGLVVSSGAATPIDAGGNPVGMDVVLPAEPDPLPVISGTILDSAGNPVSGIEVRADSQDFPISGCGVSEADGTYAMPDLRVGRYVVSVTDPNGAQPDGYYATSPSTHFVTHHGDATPLTVSANLAGIDIQFPATYTLSGVIENAASAGVEGIVVGACEEQEHGLCSSAVSAADGSFSIATLVAGSYVIHQLDPTFTYTSGYYVAGPGVVADRSAATVVAVTADVSNVSLLAVANPRVTGSVTDPGSVGLEGIEVSLCLASDEFECIQGVTEAGGAYAIGVNPGTYVVQIMDPAGDHPSGYIGPGGVEVASVGDARQVTVGSTDESIGSVAFADGGRVSGTIENDGSPAPFISFAICRSESDCFSGGESDDNGLFRSRAVLPADYLLAAFTDEGTLWYVLGGPAVTDAASATTVVVGTTDVTGIVFDVPLPTSGTPTPEGDDVLVVPTDPATGTTPIELTFDQVTAAGETSLTVSDFGPGTPAGFQLGVPPTWFDISTTASFDGLVTICISYADIAFSNESMLRLFHYDTSTATWQDRTTSLDTATNVICGQTDSFSPFAVFERKMAFTGFRPPIEGPPAVNKAKAGDKIKLDFGLGGNFGLSVLANGSPASEPTNCTTGATIGGLQPTTPVHKKHPLQYVKKNGLYRYEWKTDKDWAETCRRLTLTFSDGTSATAAFDFRKPPKPPKGH